MAPDGTLLGLEGDRLREWRSGHAASSAVGRVDVEQVRAISVSTSGEWILVDGSPLAVLDRTGARVWTIDPPRAVDLAGWMGDRVVWGAEGKVWEVHPGKARSREVGPLPSADGGTWSMGPGGALLLLHGATASLFPPPQPATVAASAPGVTALPGDGTPMRWMDQHRWLAFGPQGLHLYYDTRPVALWGDLKDTTEADLLRRLMPTRLGGGLDMAALRGLGPAGPGGPGQPGGQSGGPGGPPGGPGVQPGQPGGLPGQPGQPAGQPGQQGGPPGQPGGPPAQSAGQPGQQGGPPGQPGQQGGPPGQPGSPPGQPGQPGGPSSSGCN